jgi:hypothetical protein
MVFTVAKFFVKTQMVKVRVCQIHVIRYLGGVLAPCSPLSILIDALQAGFASLEDDLSIAPKGLTNLKFDQLRLYQYF